VWWIYPWRILRRDAISATAIRKAPRHDAGRRDRCAGPDFTQSSEVAAGGRRFRNDNGVLTEGVRE